MIYVYVKILFYPCINFLGLSVGFWMIGGGWIPFYLKLGIEFLHK